MILFFKAVTENSVDKHVDGRGDKTGHRPETVGMDNGSSLHCSVYSMLNMLEIL